MKKLSRRSFVQTAAATGIVASTRPARAFSMANDEVRLGFIGCGGRAGEHLSAFSKMTGVAVAGLCDPDQKRMEDAKDKFGQSAKTWVDLRALIEDKNIDAVVVAACNHWHCLAAVWAMQAGKDVYVEKPLSHSQWEGMQTVAAARKYNRICQVGTQQRSDPMQAEIKKFLHEEKALGKIVSARVNRFGVRASIGRRETPLTIDPRIDYNLWLGPAQDRPIFRNSLQYDWHWDWNTGSGEMGNWGVHVLDDLRNNVFLDKVTLPKRIFGGGGRLVWNDAGETPNVHFVYFDTGSIPVVIGLTNLPENASSTKSPKCPGPGSGYIAYCEGGRFEGQRGSATAFDQDGNVIKKFKGNSGNGLHQMNFLEAVRKRDRTLLNTEVEVGHHTTGWCNLANIAFRTGTAYSQDKADSLKSKEWSALVDEMKQLVTAHGLNMNAPGMMLGPMLSVDAKTEMFIGENADQANQFLKR
ncbi:MAG: Gfo/Idh/MocA family oxidoreductase, partial [Pirellula sp.]